MSALHPKLPLSYDPCRRKELSASYHQGCSGHMKTIYTDRFGLYPWALLFLSVMFLWRAYETFAGVRHAPVWH
jgi:hypothetical protein